MADDIDKNFDALAKAVLSIFQIESFRDSQSVALKNLLRGKDVMVIQPTGSGKSVIFQAFPLFRDALTKCETHSIGLIISPLSSLMQDQVNYLHSVGISATFIGEEQTDDKIKKDVEQGRYQLVFGSPESFLGSSRWRTMLSSKIYQERLCLVAVDEAHCIQHWGYAVKKGEHAFRKWFSRINEIRSLVPGVPLLALTATATKVTKAKIIKALQMDDAVVVSSSPNRTNITYAVRTVSGGASATFAPYIKWIKASTTDSSRVIIYCQTIKIVAQVYGIFKGALGGDMYLTKGDLKSCVVEMFHARVDKLNMEHIIKDFANPQGKIRVLIATIAYGMGINCRNVDTIIHYGPSRNMEAYMQESGRAGRDTQNVCKAIILYSNVMLQHCTDDIKEYVHNNTTCRRIALLAQFGEELDENEKPLTPHECCDICQAKCKCAGARCSYKYVLSSDPVQPVIQERRERVVSSSQRDQLCLKLKYMESAMINVLRRTTGSRLFTSPHLLTGFGDVQIKQVVEHCHLLFTSEDIHRYVDIWQPSVADEILVALEQCFGDTGYHYADQEEEGVNVDDLLCFWSWDKDQDDEIFQNIPLEFMSLADDSDDMESEVESED